VLISRDEPAVEIFRLTDKKEWIHSVFTGLKATAVQQSIGLKLPLAALYEEVEFEPSAKPDPLFVVKPATPKPRASKK
jgi:Uma2 family endonuclease